MAIMIKARMMAKAVKGSTMAAHKYIQRRPKANGKGWNYLYIDFLHPIETLKILFRMEDKKIDDMYEKNNIKEDYGIADKQIFGAHVLEYLLNKVKWDKLFADRKNRDVYKKPVKLGSVKKIGDSGRASEGKKESGSGGQKGTGSTGGLDEKKENRYTFNKTLMRKVWSIFNKQEDAADGQNSVGTRQRELPPGTQTVRNRGSEEVRNIGGVGAVSESGNNVQGTLFSADKSGSGPGRDVRLTVKETKDVRAACLKLLAKKTDDQMTEADKNLLRQYEGAGGLGEGDATTHGTLYEYYTPRNVVKKVWELVDKYIPGKKSVLEPSAGTGRFAEDRPLDSFTLNEYDDISSRICGILHPDQEIKQGAFQAMFKPGKPYEGKKYDVVIGNPPYGEYQGLWKGKGEGKEHRRYEEYFIDRGLDTMREGGVMAFVVPSGFLDGKNDEIKAKIAAKGKLLEAWRLPNGTFNTTGVGTDIVIVRKEKGDPADFSDSNYFIDNSTHILGNVTTGKNAWGKDQTYVNLREGDTWDSVMDNINVNAVEATPIGVPTQKEELTKTTVKETKSKKKKSENEARRNRSEAMMGNQNAAGARGGTDSMAEFNAKYNKHIDPQALPVWMATQWDGSVDLGELDAKSRKFIEKSGNYIKSADGKYYDIVNFASGNIYGKLDALERDKELLPKGEYERQKSILEKVLPKAKSVMEFEESPISAFAKNFLTSETMNYGDGPEQIPLTEAFKRWIRQNNRDDLAIRSEISPSDILEYVDQVSVRAARGYSEAQKEANKIEVERTKTLRREEAERLFNQYIREQLSIEDQKRFADTYNRQFNSTVHADFTKIPIFIEGISKTFKGKDFIANKSQIKGNAWLANQGNGIVAFDVGVGKTITAIMAAVQDMQMGRCKKPLICVPKAVYKNWIAEIHQMFPGVKINELGNFGDIDAYTKTVDVDQNTYKNVEDREGNQVKVKIGSTKTTATGLNIQEGTVSVCTYEALQKMGFSDDTLEDELKESFSEALDSMTDEEHAQARNGDKKAKRKDAKQKESIMTKVGQASRTKDGSNGILWEYTGFDHITVDEAHNFRRSFSTPKNLERGNSDEFKDISGGGESLRGLKLFAITQLIQKANNGRNVHLLTATPFLNQPVEIYNMLAYVAREKLKAAGINNFHEFLTQFAELKPELAVKANGNIEQKNVMKGFKNLQALQSLINQYIMKIDGEDAGIIRPDPEDHKYFLTPTAEQRDMMEKIRAYMEANPDPKEDPGATLRCLGALLQISLSPALINDNEYGGFRFLDQKAARMVGIKEDLISAKETDYVKASPKMTFLCEQFADIYKQNPDKGQIMYIPEGIEHYDNIKKYLISKGVPEDAIAYLAPAPKGKKAPPYLKGGDDGNDQKEAITQAFNDPDNKLKIIIGGDTMKEGVNLNGNTINTGIAEIPWNPTDLLQLKGRSHRQGNRQGKVHFTIPLMNDSVDSFLYQKHDEKGKRLDTLWNSQKDKIDVGGIDPEEIKFALIKDPKKRADLQIKVETAEMNQKRKIAAATSDKIYKMASEHKTLANEISGYQKDMSKMRQTLADFNAKTDTQLQNENENLDYAIKNKFNILSIYDDFVSVRGKNLKELRQNYVKNIKDQILDAQKTMQRNKGKMETIENTFKHYGIDDVSNSVTIERVRKRYSEQASQLEAQVAAIEHSRDAYIKQAAEQIKAKAKPGQSVEEAIAEGVNNVAGYHLDADRNKTPHLYSMDIVKEREAKRKAAQFGEMKKSFVLLLPKRIHMRLRG
jgi:hypothetical protein